VKFQVSIVLILKFIVFGDDTLSSCVQGISQSSTSQKTKKSIHHFAAKYTHANSLITYKITLDVINNEVFNGNEGFLSSGNVCYHSVQNVWFFGSLSNNLKIKIYRTIIIRFVEYGCRTWSLTLRKESRLRVFERRVLRRIFGPKRDKVAEG
jgi:hypothetical protein